MKREIFNSQHNNTISQKQIHGTDYMTYVSRIDRALRASRFVPCFWNIKDRVAELDKDYIDLLGIPLEKYSFTGKEFFESMLHPLDVPLIEELFQKAYLRTEEDADPSKFEVFRIRFSDKGKYYWMETQIIEVYQNEKGEPTLIEGIIKNITKEKEQSLLLETREKEKELAQAKNEFFSTLSHELRTPMNIIQGMSKILAKSELDFQQRETLKKVEEASELLLSIINDLLNFSQLYDKKQLLNLQPLSLKNSLVETDKLYHDKALSKGLIFEVIADPDLPPRLLGDRTKLEQVLNKLIDNAIKFTPRGKVRLNCSLLDQKEDVCQIEFTISDEGIGIPDEKKTELFKPFSLVDASDSRRHRGSGLGLAISHHLVELMNGRIKVESTPGKGSLFSFTIPMIISLEEKKQNEREITYPGSRVLVVDDNPLNREIAVDIFKHAGISPITASSGLEALDLIAREKPELVFMDIQMPHMDGLTATRKQRQRESAAEHIPIVAMTANATAMDREMSFEAGMDGHLTKPLILKEIYRVLDHWLGDYRQIGNRKEKDWERFPRLPGIKMEETLERFAGEYDTLIMLIMDFMEDYKEIGRELLELNKLNDQDEIHKRIHGLKGVSGSLGIENIYRASHILTNQYKEKNQVVKADLLGLINLIEQFCDQMDLFLTGKES